MFLTELGDLKRFANPRQLMAYLGWFRLFTRAETRDEKGALRQRDLPAWAIEQLTKGQKGKCVAVVAAARELACFLAHSMLTLAEQKAGSFRGRPKVGKLPSKAINTAASASSHSIKSSRNIGVGSAIRNFESAKQCPKQLYTGSKCEGSIPALSINSAVGSSESTRDMSLALVPMSAAPSMANRAVYGAAGVGEEVAQPIVRAMHKDALSQTVFAVQLRKSSLLSVLLIYLMSDLRA